jgi:hypothetical protein
MNVMVATGQAGNVAQNTMLPCNKLCSPLLATRTFLRPVEIGAALSRAIRMVRVAVVMHSLRLLRLVRFMAYTVYLTIPTASQIRR